jgi:hypothetical protein
MSVGWSDIGGGAVIAQAGAGIAAGGALGMSIHQGEKARMLSSNASDVRAFEAAGKTMDQGLIKLLKDNHLVGPGKPYADARAAKVVQWEAAALVAERRSGVAMKSAGVALAAFGVAMVAGLAALRAADQQA